MSENFFIFYISVNNNRIIEIPRSIDSEKIKINHSIQKVIFQHFDFDHDYS